MKIEDNLKILTINIYKPFQPSFLLPPESSVNSSSNPIIFDELCFSSELSFAIQYCRVLKLTVLSSKHGEASPNLSGSALRELRSIRDSINKILDGAADVGGTSIANTEEPGEAVSSTVAKE